MIINHNMMAMNTHRQLSANNTAGSKSLEKLSSGFRINRAGDDAAGLAISEKMRGQIRGLSQASRNAQDGISLIQTAEGALNETHSILQRMRELAVQSATDTNTAADRSKIQAEVDQLAKEITRISNTTEFNTRNLLAGGLSTVFHIGANEGQNVDSSIDAMDAFSLGVATHKALLGTFDGSGTGLTVTNFSTDGLGRGLSAQTYAIKVVHSGASASVVSNNIAGAITSSGAYSGDRNVTLMVRIDTVGAVSGSVQTASISTDNGNTWTAATVDDGTGSGAITYMGYTVNIADNAGNASGQMATFSLTAAHDTIQLSGTAAIGEAVKVYNDMTTVTIGDAATGRTITINSTNLGSLTTGVATLEVALDASDKATFDGDGNILEAAKTVAGVDVSTQATADKAISIINNALETVSAERSKLGAMQNRLEHTIANLDTSAENLQASESRIRDVDMAKEMMEFTKNSILQQAATAMLAQANQQPQSVLQLLR